MLARHDCKEVVKPVLWQGFADDGRQENGQSKLRLYSLTSFQQTYRIIHTFGLSKSSGHDFIPMSMDPSPPSHGSWTFLSMGL